MRLRAIHLKADYVRAHPYCLSGGYVNHLSTWLPEMPVGVSVTSGELPGHPYCVEITYVDDLPPDAEVIHCYGSFPH